MDQVWYKGQPVRLARNGNLWFLYSVKRVMRPQSIFSIYLEGEPVSGEIGSFRQPA